MLALVLAAGSGRRLGGCKALLDLGGTTALERCLAALREGGAGNLRVVLGADASEVVAATDLPGVEVVVNPHPEAGQTSSLKAGLAAGPGTDDGFMLHTVDHPLVRAEDVAALLEAWRRRGPDTRIVVPSVTGRRGHPAIFAAALALEFAALGDDEPAHRVVRSDAARIEHLELSWPWLVRDIDTREDLAAARREVVRPRGDEPG